MKGKDGSIITTEREQADRSVEYFCEVQKHPQPDEPADPPPVTDDLNIDTSPTTVAEVRNAIKAMKSGKAPGVDSIHAEMLKADLSTATRVLTNLFDTIWDKETIPSNIFISCNYIDTIHYQCFLLLTYNPNNISKHNSPCSEFLICDLPFSTSLINGVGN